MLNRSLAALDLPVFQFYGRRPPENGNRNAQFATLGIDFFDDPSLILKWAIRDFHTFAHFETHFRFYLFFALFHLREHAVHFRLTHWDRFVFGAGKTDHSRRFANEIPGPSNELIVFVEQMHVHDQIAGKKFSRRLAFLPLLDFRHPFSWDEHLINEIAHFLGFDPLLDVLLDLVLLAGEHMDDKPLIFACQCLRHINATG